ncbi:tRNA-dihydrouridine synthase Psta_3365, partial [hydrothermal vent metagenome]
MTHKNELQIGSLSFDFIGLQAALSGYSDWPMRVIAKRLGAAYTLCEVMIDQFVLNVKDQRKKNRRFFKVSNEEHPVGGQLMGADPKEFG